MNDEKKEVGDVETYWEERTAALEGAVERLMVVVVSALPSTHGAVQSIINEWADIRDEIHKEYQAKESENE